MGCYYTKLVFPNTYPFPNKILPTSKTLSATDTLVQQYSTSID